MRILIAGIAAMVATSAFAAKPTEEALGFCTSVSEMAGSIMKGRQAEVSMAKMMKATSGDPQMDNLGADIIKDAYKTSAFRTPENQNRAVSEFENKWFSACLEARSK